MVPDRVREQEDWDEEGEVGVGPDGVHISVDGLLRQILEL